MGTSRPQGRSEIPVVHGGNSCGKLWFNNNSNYYYYSNNSTTTRVQQAKIQRHWISGHWSVRHDKINQVIERNVVECF